MGEISVWAGKDFLPVAQDASETARCDRLISLLVNITRAAIAHAGI
jgi:hypothetical protein